MPSGIYRKATKRSRHGLKKFLGELELAILDIAWTRSPVTVREVHERLSRDRPLAYTTVMTVMGRLADKGVLGRRRQGKAYLYQPTRSREELRGDLAADVARALLKDFGQVAVVQFVRELDRIDPGALARLGDLAEEGQDEDGK